MQDNEVNDQSHITS